jgi:integrase
MKALEAAAFLVILALGLRRGATDGATGNQATLHLLRTRGHVSGRKDWIKRLYPQPATVGYRHQRRGYWPNDEKQVNWPSRGPDIKVRRAVCRECNSGWMNELDHAAEAVFATRAAMGVPVQLVAKADKTTVARWCSLVAILFDCASEVRLGRATYDALYTGGVPDGTAIWLGGRMPERGWGTLAFGSTKQLLLVGDVLAPAQRDRDHGSAYFVTFGVGHFFAQVLMPTPDTRAGAQIERRVKNTREDYRRDIEQYAVPFFGRMRLSEIAPQHVKRWLVKMADDGCAAGTIRNALAPVRAMLADAAEEGIIRSNPAAGVRIPAHAKQADERPKELAPAVLTRMREKVTDPALQLVVDFLVASGLRISELIALDWSDVNLSTCRVSIRRRLYRGMDAPKSKTSRRVLKISPTMAQRLRALWESQGRPSPDSPVFLSPEGCRLDYSNLYKRLVPAMRAAGIEYGAFHRLRHTTGTELRRRGVPLEDIQLQLGHHDLAFTQRVYVHTDAEDGPDPVLLDDLAGCIPSLRVVEGEAAA